MVLFDRDAALLEKRIAAISISCFALISNIIRNTLGGFHVEMQMDIRWRKM